MGRSSRASDVYSLAVIIFEMLCGKRFAMLSEGDEQETRKALNGYSDKLIELLVQGTSILPAARPQDIRGFTIEVSKALDAEA
jgi:serine/threonine protein kinase